MDVAAIKREVSLYLISSHGWTGTSNGVTDFEGASVCAACGVSRSSFSSKEVTVLLGQAELPDRAHIGFYSVCNFTFISTSDSQYKGRGDWLFRRRTHYSLKLGLKWSLHL
jgi:hypothetical protein